MTGGRTGGKRLGGRQWLQLRRRVLDAAGWRCARCGDAGPLEVHHRDHDRANNDPANLEPLCRDCHRAVHDRLRDRPVARRWRDLVREAIDRDHDQ